MELRKVFAIELLLATLITFGCAGTGNYEPTGGPDMMGCSGDEASPYPPYCHPSPD